MKLGEEDDKEHLLNIIFLFLTNSFSMRVHAIKLELLSSSFLLNLPAASYAICCPSAWKLEHQGRFRYLAARQRRRACRGFSEPLRCPHPRRPTRLGSPTPCQRPLIENQNTKAERFRAVGQQNNKKRDLNYRASQRTKEIVKDTHRHVIYRNQCPYSTMGRELHRSRSPAPHLSTCV